MAIRSFRDLQVWQRAMSLAEEVYTITARFPRSELYGLVPQLRRAAVSIPSNVAEGHPQSRRQYLRHVLIAIGSEAELQTQLELACRLNMVGQAGAQTTLKNAAEVGRMLRALATSLAAIDSYVAPRDPLSPIPDP